jgi:hypothetical protein
MIRYINTLLCSAHCPLSRPHSGMTLLRYLFSLPFLPRLFPGGNRRGEPPEPGRAERVGSVTFLQETKGGGSNEQAEPLAVLIEGDNTARRQGVTKNPAVLLD